MITTPHSLKPLEPTSMRTSVVLLIILGSTVPALQRSSAQSAALPAIERQFDQQEALLAQQRTCLYHYRSTEQHLDFALQTIALSVNDFDSAQINQFVRLRDAIRRASDVIASDGNAVKPLCSTAAISTLDKIDGFLAGHNFPATQDAFDQWVAARYAETLQAKAAQLR